jgi:hypothetical protein
MDERRLTESWKHSESLKLEAVGRRRFRRLSQHRLASGDVRRECLSRSKKHLYFGFAVPSTPKIARQRKQRRDRFRIVIGFA